MNQKSEKVWVSNFLVWKNSCPKKNLVQKSVAPRNFMSTKLCVQREFDVKKLRIRKKSCSKDFLVEDEIKVQKFRVKSF